MNIIANQQLNGQTLALETDTTIRHCDLTNVNLTSNGHAVNIEDCHGSGENPQMVFDGVVVQLSGGIEP